MGVVRPHQLQNELLTIIKSGWQFFEKRFFYPKRCLSSLLLSQYSVFKTDWWRQLRDIFRVHSDTACNTHDLLECPCDGTTVAMNLKSDPVGNVNDDDPETKSGFIYASNVRPHELDAQDKAVSHQSDRDIRLTQ